MRHTKIIHTKVDHNMITSRRKKYLRHVRMLGRAGGDLDEFENNFWLWP